MSSYIKRMLLPDERLIHIAQLHWIVYFWGAVLLMAGAALGYFGPFFAGEAARQFFNAALPEFALVLGTIRLDPIRIVALILIAFGALALLGGFVQQISTELAITSQRVIAKHGFISCTTFELLLTKVEGANVDQTVLGRLLGFGTILVKGTGGGIAPIDHVAAPYRFHSVLMQMVERQRA